jgi:hypothetical protein
MIFLARQARTSQQQNKGKDRKKLLKQRIIKHIKSIPERRSAAN